MVGLWWGSLFENSPEAGDPIAGLAAQHPFGTKVYGGVWVKLKQEQIVVVGRLGRRPESEQVYDSRRLAARRLGESGKRSKQLHGRSAR